jgi:hypothetical protein
MSKNCENSWFCGRYSGSITCPDIGVSSIRVRRFEMLHQGEIIHLYEMLGRAVRGNAFDTDFVSWNRRIP